MTSYDLQQRASRVRRAAVARGLCVNGTSCEACGTQGPTLIQHHWSYEKEHWTDTITLCLSCHRRVHWGHIPEPRTGRMYQLSIMYNLAASDLPAEAERLVRQRHVKTERDRVILRHCRRMGLIARGNGRLRLVTTDNPKGAA